MRSLVLVLGILLGATTAYGQEGFRISLEPPAERAFVVDRAELLEIADEALIVQVADKLLTEKVTPIIVVTIESMSKYGGAGLRIETFARLLFDQWKIGHAELNGSNWNTGILVVVSKGDRKARIELGAGWGLEKNDVCQKIMNEYMVPAFKAGDFAKGIQAGVEALDKMARDKPLPKKPVSKKAMFFMIAFVGIAIFMIVSLFRNGRKGWAWILLALLLGVIGTMLYSAMRNSGSGGSFGGGSFGGGFSGGGGASGSW